MTTPTTAPTPGGPDTVVLIHGLWMTPLSWKGWVDRLTAAGWKVQAPAWPGMEGTVEELRADTSPYEKLGVTEIVDHYDGIIRALDAPPIIIGHSFGGAFTQVLLSRGLGAAGVALSPAPVKGILALPISSLRSSFPVLKNPANRNRAVPLTEKQFHQAFATSLSEADSKRAWETQAIPGPGRPLFQAATANFLPHSPLKVDRKKADRAPLLVMGGTMDQIAPPAIVKATQKLYRHVPSRTDMQIWDGRSHFIAAEPGWEDVADKAVAWATEVTAP